MSALTGREVIIGEVGKEFGVTHSCGCIFCDLSFDTKEHEGAHYHQVTSMGTGGKRLTVFPVCPVKTLDSKR